MIARVVARKPILVLRQRPAEESAVHRHVHDLRPQFLQRAERQRDTPERHRPNFEQQRLDEALHDEVLTPREEEIVKLVAEAHTNEEIGEMLFISKKTVERHRANILEKLGMRDRVELTRYAIRRGLVEP